MPDHDSATLLTRQTKRRRVDIGVKRTVGSVIFARARETLLERINQSHVMDQDGDCPLVSHGPSAVTNGDGEKSNVLRKLLKRANSYEDSMMPFPGATIISQLLKSNMGKNGGSDSAFQVLDPGSPELPCWHSGFSLARLQITVFLFAHRGAVTCPAAARRSRPRTDAATLPGRGTAPPTASPRDLPSLRHPPPPRPPSGGSSLTTRTHHHSRSRSRPLTWTDFQTNTFAPSGPGWRISSEV